MSTTTIEMTKLSIRVHVGRGISRGHFIFHTNQDVSAVVTHHSTVRPKNMEERLPRFSDGVQAFIKSLLQLDSVEGVDIGNNSFKLYCKSGTTLDNIYEDAKSRLLEHLEWSGRPRKKVVDTGYFA